MLYQGASLVTPMPLIRRLMSFGVRAYARARKRRAIIGGSIAAFALFTGAFFFAGYSSPWQEQTQNLQDSFWGPVIISDKRVHVGACDLTFHRTAYAHFILDGNGSLYADVTDLPVALFMDGHLVGYHRERIPVQGKMEDTMTFQVPCLDRQASHSFEIKVWTGQP